ncbi:DHA2 family efflux MFS transporter permease subunit [Azospirillum doebereinerae]|uniref:DHA2 family efflux MFS transporter permease subunit n=1 Tax=Azospirillum doebereinerae TaxID=92933 RepID=A0A3S0VK80_9PROT|nr:DHA2 family efflux MFS transporter permease subunit [Azospirillum doebereinerae]MCG5241442.1 DHA2 family efflux MFS transporter permease subunit [Azospirillum doebereinerae]RUQ74476.1 DHA2 family efflux MFS transporter permease subunit [Azospirillum doebereinerae]
MAADHHETPHRGMITLSIMLATVMQVLDTTIANVALPNMQGSLGAAQDTITWVLTSYIVAAAIATPATGWLADRFGRKRLFLIAVAGFTSASVLCGLAGSLSQMVAFRLVQGVFGAALVPLSQSVLLDINPKERHGQAMALWGAGIMVGPIAGPTLGGWLTDSFSWRWVFYINLPVGILAFFGMLVFLHETKGRTRGFDLFGFAMLGLAVGAFQMMLDRGEQLDWFGSTEILVETALAVCAFWVFAVHIATAHGNTAREPFIDPHLLRDRNFVTGLILIFVIGVILLATMALLPPMLQNLLGYPTVTTGLVLAPRGIGTMISMLVVGRLVRAVDARLLILAGILLTSWSLWYMTGFTIVMDRTPIIVSGIVQGLGLGLVFVPLSTIAFATLEPRLRTDAASLFSLVRNLGSSVGISVVMTLLSQNTQINHANLAAHLTPFKSVLTEQVEAAPQALGMLNAEVTRQAAMIAYLDDFKLMMYVALLVIPMLLLLRRPKPGAAAGGSAHESAVME